MKKIAIIGFGLLLALIVSGYSQFSTKEQVPTKQITYHVRPGDTLWDIALLECPDESRDIREVIDDIKKRNGLPNGKPLKAGTILKLEVPKK